MLRQPMTCVLVGISAALLAAASGRAQCTAVFRTEPIAPGNAAALVNSTPNLSVDIQNVSLADVSRERVQLAVRLGLTAHRNLTLRQVSFDNFRINDLPFYVAPVDGPVQLEKDKTTALPKPLEVNIYYRDLDSVRPLISMLSENQVHVDGTANVALDLPALAKMALWTRRGRLRVPVRRAMTLELPGGELSRLTAVSLVEAGESALALFDAGRNAALNWTSERRQQLWQNALPALLAARSHFVLTDAGGEKSAFECNGVGFRISDTQFLLPRQLLEPWRFDQEFALALQDNRARLEDREFQLSVWAAGTLGQADVKPPVFEMRRGDFRVVHTGEDKSVPVLVPDSKGRARKVRVILLDGSGNLALFQFNAVAGKAVAPLKPADARLATEWKSLAVFRFPGSGEQSRPDLVFVAAKADHASIRLQSPLDSSAWGAPLLSPDGLVGVVQSEKTAIPLAEVYRLLKIPAPAVADPAK